MAIKINICYDRHATLAGAIRYSILYSCISKINSIHTQVNEIKLSIILRHEQKAYNRSHYTSKNVVTALHLTTGVLDTECTKGVFRFTLNTWTLILQPVFSPLSLWCWILILCKQGLSSCEPEKCFALVTTGICGWEPREYLHSGWHGQHYSLSSQSELDLHTTSAHICKWAQLNTSVLVRTICNQ